MKGVYENIFLWIDNLAIYKFNILRNVSELYTLPQSRYYGWEIPALLAQQSLTSTRVSYFSKIIFFDDEKLPASKR